LTNVDGKELSDPAFRPFFAKAEELSAFIMLHPNGFTHGERLTKLYFNNILGNPLETALALHNLIFSGTLARFPDLKLMAVHGGGYLPAYSGRIDHAWGARRDSLGDLPLQPTTYLRQVYLDTVVFSYHQLAYLLDLFGPDRILMGTDYPYDMAEYNPIGHIAGVDGMDETTLAQIAGGKAMRLLQLGWTLRRREFGFLLPHRQGWECARYACPDEIGTDFPPKDVEDFLLTCLGFTFTEAAG
jgi:aminocarboxymuconate-semialdehyde decarboxylase